jgi:hypothetical protein
MAQQSKLDVSKWQASRRKFQYTPVLWFYYRMIEVAVLDARGSQWDIQPGNAARVPTDEALLARDWIARSETAPAWVDGVRPPRNSFNFPECCLILGLNPEAERIALLELIDKAQESDDDEAWARLEVLSASDPADDVQPLFDAPRVVPALDQMVLF